MSADLACLVRDRALEELATLERQRLEPGATAREDEASSRLRVQAHARQEAAEHYHRLLGSLNDVDTGRVHEMLRTLCLLARVDQSHPAYEGVMSGCPVDRMHPLW